MAFHLFGKKKEEEEIPEDIGFENPTPPTLANPTGLNTNLPPNPIPPTNNLPPANLPPTNNLPTNNLPNPIPPTQNLPNPSSYPVEISRPQPVISPQVEEEVKLLSTKIESINVRLNTLSQKLDYLINLIRQRYQV